MAKNKIIINQHSCKDCGSAQTCTIHTDNIRPKKAYVGILDIFKIGIGPSSSHTMGPMWAAKQFSEALLTYGQEKIHCVEAHLYGSLALTGKGHATDKAIILGLAGFQPDTVDPDAADQAFLRICNRKFILLNGAFPIDFEIEKHIIFHYDIELPQHPNGLKIIAYDSEGNPFLKETYFSVGGGFIKTEKEMNYQNNNENFDANTKDTPTTIASEIDMESLFDVDTPAIYDNKIDDTAASSKVPYDFTSAYELLTMAKSNNITIAELMFQNECVLKNISRDELYACIDTIADVFDSCVERGLKTEGKMLISEVPRRAAQIKKRLTATIEKGLTDPLAVSDWIALYARAVNEENACGGRVVTAPTNGAAGTLPAVLTYYRRFIPSYSIQGVRDFLATSAAIGLLCIRNASISGAEAGCQAEVGSACAMAAAGLTSVLNGTLKQIENAAEIGLEHCLGMTCDPIMGLVQIPCIERNCVAAVKAVMASRLALLGDGDHEVSLDSCIETMYRTGLDLQSKYRETSNGGLAKYAKKMFYT